jgi:putative PIN family toxin of toxin-antitoxin system
MRVVLDANVLVSALISARGAPAQIVHLWEQQAFELVLSPPILDELERVLHYPRIQGKYGLSDEHVGRFLELIRSTATLVEASTALAVIQEDPTDDRYLECAVEARASYLVTGDHHLLDLKAYRGIAILQPGAFLVALRLDTGG